jgi:Tol biopolymer transport system component
MPTPSAQDEPHFSFDGKWLAYDSSESDTWEVYVASFPEADQKVQISTNGGVQPRWREDSKELYYLSLDGKMMAVGIKGGTKIERDAPRILFDTGLDVRPLEDQYDVTHDGQRFLILNPVMETSLTPITITLKWPLLLKE